MKNYNGWTNRNTWLINLWFSEMIDDYVTDSEEKVTADDVEEFVLEIIESEVDGCSFMLRDFIDYSGINWNEILGNGEQ
jgi:hypothetical protein